MSLNRTVNNMLEFQKEKNIVGQCVGNVMYCLQNHKSMNKEKLYAKAVYMVYHTEDSERFDMFAGHLVLTFANDNIIDPSYETQSKTNKRYFHSIADILIHYPFLLQKKEYLRFIISLYIEFVKISDLINNNRFIDLPIDHQTYFNTLSDAMKSYTTY